MFLLLGELSQVEAEVMALQWNALEADRVGLPEDARIFRARMGTYQEQVNAIRKKGRPPNSTGRIWKRNTWL